MTTMLRLSAKDGSPISAKGEVFGFFAVHESVGSDGVTLSHVPTGLAISKGLTYQQAVSAVVRLAHLDWSFVEKSSAQALKDQVAAVLREIKGGAHEETAPAK